MAVLDEVVMLCFMVHARDKSGDAREDCGSMETLVAEKGGMLRSAVSREYGFGSGNRFIECS